MSKLLKLNERVFINTKHIQSICTGVGPMYAVITLISGDEHNITQEQFKSMTGGGK